jgi:hypothetical protein
MALLLSPTCGGGHPEDNGKGSGSRGNGGYGPAVQPYLRGGHPEDDGQGDGASGGGGLALVLPLVSSLHSDNL